MCKGLEINGLKILICPKIVLLAIIRSGQGAREVFHWSNLRRCGNRTDKSFPGQKGTGETFSRLIEGECSGPLRRAPRSTRTVRDYDRNLRRAGFIETQPRGSKNPAGGRGSNAYFGIWHKFIEDGYLIEKKRASGFMVGAQFNWSALRKHKLDSWYLPLEVATEAVLTVGWNAALILFIVSAQEGKSFTIDREHLSKMLGWPRRMINEYVRDLVTAGFLFADEKYHEDKRIANSYSVVDPVIIPSSQVRGSTFFDGEFRPLTWVVHIEEFPVTMAAASKECRSPELIVACATALFFRGLSPSFAAVLLSDRTISNPLRQGIKSSDLPRWFAESRLSIEIKANKESGFWFTDDKSGVLELIDDGVRHLFELGEIPVERSGRTLRFEHLAFQRCDNERLHHFANPTLPGVRLANMMDRCVLRCPRGGIGVWDLTSYAVYRTMLRLVSELRDPYGETDLEPPIDTIPGIMQ